MLFACRLRIGTRYARIVVYGREENDGENKNVELVFPFQSSHSSFPKREKKRDCRRREEGNNKGISTMIKGSDAKKEVLKTNTKTRVSAPSWSRLTGIKGKKEGRKEEGKEG